MSRRIVLPDLITPPPALASEDAVLGACLSDRAALAEALAAGLPGAAFLQPPHATAYAAAVIVFTMSGAVAPESVVAELAESGRLDGVGAGLVFGLASEHAALDAALFRDHLDRLLSAYKLRAFFSRSDDLRRAVCDERSGSLRERISRLRAGAADMLREVSDGYATLAEGDQLLELARRHTPVVPTGLPSLDRAIGGYEPSRLAMLMGRTNHGKTTVAVDLACRMAARCRQQREGQVVYFTCEMSNERLSKRIATAHGEDFLRGLPLALDEAARPDTAHLFGRCLALSAREPIRLVVFDYLDYTGERGSSDRERYNQALIGMHALAKRLECPVVVLNQTNRQIDKRGGITEPQLDDARETGEQQAELVLAVYYEWIHWRQTGRRTAEPDDRDLKLFVLKKTHGGVGMVTLDFDRKSGRITCPEERSMMPPGRLLPPFDWS